MKNCFKRFVSIMILISMVCQSVPAFAYELASDNTNRLFEKLSELKDEILSGSSVDEIASGGSFVNDNVEDILNNNSLYSFLDQYEKHLLNDTLGVRTDTMMQLQERGYLLKDSIAPALVMQRMQCNVEEAETIISKNGESKALSLSNEYSLLTYDYPEISAEKEFLHTLARKVEDGRSPKMAFEKILNDEIESGSGISLETYNKLKAPKNVMRSGGEAGDNDTGDNNTNFKGPFVAKTDVDDTVNYNTGALIHREHILSLPGVNGNDFELSLQYDTSKRIRYNYTNTSATLYSDTKNDHELWELNFPRIMFQPRGELYEDHATKSYMRMSDGTIYTLNFVNHQEYYLFVENAFRDKKLVKDSNHSFSTAHDISKYKLEYIDGRSDYFNDDGYYIGSVDRFGNTLKVDINNSTHTTTITDTMGRTVSINYSYTQNNTQRIMTVTTPDGGITKYYSEYYPINNGTRTVNFVWKPFKKEETIKYHNGANVVSTVNTTTYSYNGGTYYTCDEDGKLKKFREILLTNVTYPTGMSVAYEYADSAKGKNPFWTDINGYEGEKYRFSRISKRTIAYENRTFPESYSYSETNYTGYIPENYHEDDYTYCTNFTDLNKLYSTYTFNEYGCNTNIVEKSYNNVNLVFCEKNLFYDNIEYMVDGFEYSNYTPLPTGVSVKDGKHYSFTVLEQYEYDEFGRLKKYKTPQTGGEWVNYTYLLNTEISGCCIPLTETYKQNETTTIQKINELDSSNQIKITNTQVKVNNVISGKTTYTYNEKGSPTTVNNYKDSSNYVTTTNTYNNNGELLSTTIGNSTIHYTYDLNGRIASKTDGEGYTTEYGYDTKDNVTFMIDGNDNLSKYVYNYAANTITYTDPRNTSTVYDYDPAGNLVSVSCGSDTLASYVYNAAMLLERETAYNRITEYNYDELGRTTEKTVKNTANSIISHDVFTYKGSGVWADVTQKSDNAANSSGNATSYLIHKQEKNDRGKVVTAKIGTLDNYLTTYNQYEYDYLGNMVHKADMIGSTAQSGNSAYDTGYAYDWQGNVTKEEYEDQSYKHYAYNWLGNKLSESDVLAAGVALSNNNKKTYTYDEQGRVTQESYFLTAGKEGGTQYTYDRNGNVTEKKVYYQTPVSNTVNYKTTQYEYDGNNNLTKEKFINNGNIIYTENEYDGNNNLIAVSAANGTKTTSYTYDKYNRVTKMTDPMGMEESYIYDLLGNMLFKTDRNGKTTHYSYNAAGKLLEEYGDSGTRASYTYNRLGQVTKLQNSNASIEYTYHDNGCIAKQTVTKGNDKYIIERMVNLCGDPYEYRLKKGSVGSTNTTLLKHYGYEYNHLHKVTSVSNWYSDNIAAYTYAPNGNILSETLANGVNVQYNYYNFNFLNTKNITKGSQTLGAYTYSYNSDGNVYSRIDNVKDKPLKTTTYSYDGLGRLTNETAVKNNTTDSISYTYDLSGNRSQMVVTGTQNYRMEYEYDDNNRLLRENKFTGSNNNFCNTTRYNYDNNGNMLYKASGNVTANTTQMGEFSITTTPGYKFERNVYDSFNRLTSTYNTYTGKSASYTYYPNDLRQSKTVDNVTTEFFWDGDDVALETDSNHNLKNIYTYGVNRIMSENAGGTKQYYMYDPHGDVQGLVNASGTLTKTYEYDAFGNEINKSATDTNPFRYCGEYYDTETDNIYLRHRYYSPGLGRFTTEDPIRDGYNWYNYVECNPITYKDFNGLEKIVVSAGVDSQVADIFISSALAQAKQYKNASKNEQVTLLIADYGINNKIKNNLYNTSNNLGIQVYFIKDRTELVNYINTKSIIDDEYADNKDRMDDKITDMSFYSHGGVSDKHGYLLLGENAYDKNNNLVFGIDDINGINSNSFKNVKTSIVACNMFLKEKDSFAVYWTMKTKGITKAYKGMVKPSLDNANFIDRVTYGFDVKANPVNLISQNNDDPYTLKYGG